MKKFVKIICIVMVMQFVVLMFAGCGKSKDASKATSSIEASSQKTAVAGEKKEGPSWKWDTSPATLSWYIDFSWYSKKWPNETCFADKLLNEKTGVTLNVITPPADSGEKLNTMIASDDLPDIITLDRKSTSLTALIQGQKLFPIPELIDQYAPTFKDTLPKSMVEKTKARDGKMYGLNSFFFSKERVTPEFDGKSNVIGTIVRKDILDQLSINPEDLTTQEGFINGMKKIKDSKIKYKGLNVSPLYFGADGYVGTMDMALPALFNIPKVDEVGNYTDYITNPKVKEMLLFGNKLYNEGILSKENFTSQRKQIEEKITAGSVACFVGNLADYKEAAKKLMILDSNVTWATIDGPRAKDGGDPVIIAQSALGWTSSVITKKSTKPDRAIKLFEYLYSEEGYLDSEYGTPGETCDVVDGKYIIKTEIQELKTKDYTTYEQKYGLGQLFWINDYFMLSPKYLGPPENPYEKWIREQGDVYKKHIILSNAFDDLEPEAGTDLNVKMKEVNDYWFKKMVAMLVAKNPDDVSKIYDETIGKLNKNGLNEIIKFEDEKFKANQLKYGAFTWPHTN